MSNVKRQLDANQNKQAPKLVWQKNISPSEPCVWSDVSVSDIGAALDAVTRAGGAIMLGVTSDGGAYSICVLYGQDKIKEYPHSAAECGATMRALAETFLDILL